MVYSLKNKNRGNLLTKCIIMKRLRDFETHLAYLYSGNSIFLTKIMHKRNLCKLNSYPKVGLLFTTATITITKSIGRK